MKFPFFRNTGSYNNQGQADHDQYPGPVTSGIPVMWCWEMVRVTIIIPISRKVIYMNLVDMFVINQNKAFFWYSPFCLKIRDTVVFHEKNLTIMLFNKSKYSINFFLVTYVLLVSFLKIYLSSNNPQKEQVSWFKTNFKRWIGWLGNKIDINCSSFLSINVKNECIGIKAIFPNNMIVKYVDSTGR